MNQLQNYAKYLGTREIVDFPWFAVYIFKEEEEEEPTKNQENKRDVRIISSCDLIDPEDMNNIDFQNVIHFYVNGDTKCGMVLEKSNDYSNLLFKLNKLGKLNNVDTSLLLNVKPKDGDSFTAVAPKEDILWPIAYDGIGSHEIIVMLDQKEYLAEILYENPKKKMVQTLKRYFDKQENNKHKQNSISFLPPKLKARRNREHLISIMEEIEIDRIQSAQILKESVEELMQERFQFNSLRNNF